MIIIMVKSSRPQIVIFSSHEESRYEFTEYDEKESFCLHSI